jgi:hypothetical protein
LSIFDEEKLKDRALELKQHAELNGIDFLIVTLENSPIPSKAFLELHFYNSNELANISSENPDMLPIILPITGGDSILAAKNPNQVKVTEVQPNLAESILTLVVSPIGDYSVYELKISYQNIDPHPIFSKINFKFRPGCFNLDCKPDLISIPPDPDPVIDYLAKDYDSFKHTMITSMMHKVPGWTSTSEADLDQVILELFSAAADELSDYQDRVMNEAYLYTCKKRLTLARHARLMNYFIHQGNQAQTVLALNVNQEIELSKLFEVWTNGIDGWTEDMPPKKTIVKTPTSIIFSSNDYSRSEYIRPHFYREFNKFKLYTWSGSIAGLKTSSKSADLAMKTLSGATMPLSEVRTLQKIIDDGHITHLLIQATSLNDLDEKAQDLKAKRQLVTLRAGPPPYSQNKSLAMIDPLTNETLLRVWWEEGLNFNICPGDSYLFHGNVLPIYQGEMTRSVFKEHGMKLNENQGDSYYERGPLGTICRISEPVLNKETKVGGEVPTTSTIRVSVTLGVEQQEWIETPDLIHSTDSDSHYTIETDEAGLSTVRFGNGINGKKLSENAEVVCTYLKGIGSAGNVGADTLLYFNHLVFPEIEHNCWNPFDVNNGRNMERSESIIRRVPEAYKSRQRRAITLQDYVDRVEEVPGVSKASAEYQWTGSWRTVRISVDPKAGFELEENLRNQIIRHLNAIKLLGEDFEIRKAHYIPLEIEVTFCVNEQYWVEDLRYIVEQEFSTRYTMEDKPAFFNPDLWTFGQNLHSSQIIGRLESISGIDHVVEIKMKRKGEGFQLENFIEIGMNEILRVANDHDHPEWGFVHFTLKGGRK